MEIKEQLINNMLWNGNDACLKELENKAYMEDIFENDNGKEIKRKKNESLGNYIDRYSIEIMRNFSEKKYSKIKTLNNIYVNTGDISEFDVKEDETKRGLRFIYNKFSHKIAASAMALMAGATILKVVSNKFL